MAASSPAITAVQKFANGFRASSASGRIGAIKFQKRRRRCLESMSIFCASLEMDPGQAARARLSGVTASMALMN
jgi:hypothetical protein